MHTRPPSLDPERETAIQLAYEAGRMALSLSTGPLEVEYKAGALGPVTRVDRELDDFLQSELNRRFPDDAIVSEESAIPGPEAHPHLGARTWYVDPIDGTTELIHGNDEWSVLIGLVESQRPGLGVVYRPRTDELYFATRGRGAYKRPPSQAQDVRLHVNEVRDPKTAVLIQSRSHPSRKVARLAKILGIEKTLALGSLGLKLCKIAEGEADLYVNSSGRCHLWDLCGPEVILREAGGDVATLDGEPIVYDRGTTALRRPFAAAASGLMPFVVRASAGMEAGSP